jgi:hypothetical protein
MVGNRAPFDCVRNFPSAESSSLIHSHCELTDFKQHQNPTVIKGIGRVQNISLISNQTLSKLLLNDIFTDDDAERSLTEIDATSASEVFIIFNLKPPVCDKNGDGVVKDIELKCFNKIWKYYLPNDEYY